MVISASRSRRSQSAYLMTDFMVALAILMIAVIPLAGLYAYEHRLARSYYYRALMMEVVDGEMEALMAGAWHSLPEGVASYDLPETLRSELPDGTLQTTLQQDMLTLEWIPAQPHEGGTISRTWRMP